MEGFQEFYVIMVVSINCPYCGAAFGIPSHAKPIEVICPHANCGKHVKIPSSPPIVPKEIQAGTRGIIQSRHLFGSGPHWWQEERWSLRWAS